MIDRAMVWEIADRRPFADHSIEQYLMDAPSLERHAMSIGNKMRGLHLAFMGDDDHLSLLLAKYFDIRITVYELDKRVIASLRMFAKLLNLKKYKVTEANFVTDTFTDEPKVDGFVTNPPYGSKNDGYGILVWVTRGLELLKENGSFVVTLPIDQTKTWTLRNQIALQGYASSCGALVVGVDTDIHTYSGLPRQDRGMMSSNIFFRVVGSPTKLMQVDPSKNPYR